MVLDPMSNSPFLLKSSLLEEPCSVSDCQLGVFPCSALGIIKIEKLKQRSMHIGEQEWHSGESARLLPMCPRFDSRTRRHMWVEFVVSSRPCSEGFSSGSLVFLPPQKSAFLNSNNSICNSRAMGLSVSVRLFCVTLVKQRHLSLSFLLFNC